MQDTSSANEISSVAKNRYRSKYNPNSIVEGIIWQPRADMENGQADEHGVTYTYINAREPRWIYQYTGRGHTFSCISAGTLIGRLVNAPAATDYIGRGEWFEEIHEVPPETQAKYKAMAEGIMADMDEEADKIAAGHYDEPVDVTKLGTTKELGEEDLKVELWTHFKAFRDIKDRIGSNAILDLYWKVVGVAEEYAASRKRDEPRYVGVTRAVDLGEDFRKAIIKLTGTLDDRELEKTVGDLLWLAKKYAQDVADEHASYVLGLQAKGVREVQKDQQEELAKTFAEYLRGHLLGHTNEDLGHRMAIIATKYGACRCGQPETPFDVINRTPTKSVGLTELSYGGQTPSMQVVEGLMREKMGMAYSSSKSTGELAKAAIEIAKRYGRDCVDVARAEWNREAKERHGFLLQKAKDDSTTVLMGGAIGKDFDHEPQHNGTISTPVSCLDIPVSQRSIDAMERVLEHLKEDLASPTKNAATVYVMAPEVPKGEEPPVIRLAHNLPYEMKTGDVWAFLDQLGVKTNSPKEKEIATLVGRYLATLNLNSPAPLNRLISALDNLSARRAVKAADDARRLADIPGMQVVILDKPENRAAVEEIRKILSADPKAEIPFLTPDAVGPKPIEFWLGEVERAARNAVEAAREGQRDWDDLLVAATTVPKPEPSQDYLKAELNKVPTALEVIKTLEEVYPLLRGDALNDRLRDAWYASEAMDNIGAAQANENGKQGPPLATKS